MTLVIEGATKTYKSSSTEWWLDQLCYNNEVSTHQDISHSKDGSGGDEDVVMDV